MLPKQNRMRFGNDFQHTMRAGVKAVSPSLIVHAARATTASPRVGFVVSKAVGNAVIRNRVKRQLRHLMCVALPDAPLPVDVVVRARPLASGADLRSDLAAAFGNALRKLPPQ